MKTALVIIALLLRALSGLLRYWKPLLLILLILSPVGPHVRWTQSYTGSPENPRFTRCDYLGSRGIIATSFAPNCPLLTWLDAREARR